MASASVWASASASAPTASVAWSSDPIEAAQAFRRAGVPVAPVSDSLIVAEGEEFAPEGPGWQAKKYGTNYYAATVSNTYLSRQAYLGAPEQCDTCAAHIDVKVPKAGRYYVLARYESPYRFEARFRIEVEQAGAKLLTRTYGARDNVKVWPFGNRLAKEVVFPWGASENVVWEGHDAGVDLAAGTARIRLIADKQPEPAARRNVDLVMLTSDKADLDRRIEKEGQLPLDGLLTQAGDVFVRLHAHDGNAVPVTIGIPNGTEHSPYWVHARAWKPISRALRPGESTEWLEVGSLLDTLADGQWTFSAKATGAAVWDVEVAAADGVGNRYAIARYMDNTRNLELGYFGNTRYSRKIRKADDSLYELVDDLRRQTVAGEPLKRTLFYAYTFEPRAGDLRYTSALDEFMRLMGATALDRGSPRHLLQAESPVRAYLDWRDAPVKELSKYCDKLAAHGQADRVAVMSLGDEISSPLPPAHDDVGYRAWLQSEKVKPQDIAAGSRSLAEARYDASSEERARNPGNFYYSKRYQYVYGAARMRERTDILKRCLPNAGIGANFSPHHGDHYLGSAQQWIALFRRDGLTMPWGEDYAFQSPVGSPQITELMVDMFRAGIRGKKNAKIYWYVMPHMPNNTPNAWRRQLYADLGHGVKTFDLFEFRPVQAAYTENHVDDFSMYREVRKSIFELGTFEDFVQDGSVAPAHAALWFSEAADAYDDHRPPFAAAERALYLAVRHGQVPLDAVLEGDDLRSYDTLYLTDLHVTKAAAQAITRWVEAGGRLVATAGAGLVDEADQPNLIMRKLYGIEPAPLEIGPEPGIRYEKQDLPFAKAFDHARRGDGSSVEVLGARQRFSADASIVTARFDDGSPAAIERKVGKGLVRFTGFLPSLAWLRPAIPLRPMDRGATDDAMVHLMPTGMDEKAASYLRVPGEKISVKVSADDVEAVAVDSPHGKLVSIVRWSRHAAGEVAIEVDDFSGTGEPRLATGGKIVLEGAAPKRTYKFNLDVADALILPK